MIYLILIVLITLIGERLGFHNQKRELVRIFVVFSFVLVGGLIALRDSSVGADTLTYYTSYLSAAGQIVGTNVENSSVEIGYIFLVQILNQISSNPQTMFIFEGVLVSIAYGWFIYRNVSDISEAYIAILAYLAFNLFSFQLSGYRQSIAMAICMFAYYFLEKRKMIPFLAVVVVAAQFHASAYFFIPAYFVAIGKSSRLKLVIVAVVGLLVRVNLGYFNQLMSLVSERYDKYGIEETGNGLMFFTILIMILFISEYYKDYILYTKVGKNRILDKVVDQFSSINYVTCLLWFMRLFTRTAERPCLYYIPATIILLTHVSSVGLFVAKDRDVTKICIAVLLIILFLYRMKNYAYAFCF